jgi:opacity protein-like surface antigen
MKKLLIGMITALLLFSCNSDARAEDGTDVKAGIKMWLNDWTRTAPEGTVRSDSVMLLGPAISLKFRNQVFANASYLFSASDYSFANQAVLGTVDRQDADFTIGYLVIPEFGLLAGYKNTRMKNRDTGIPSTVSGPLIGVRVSTPVDAAVSFYGGLNYLFTRFKGTTSSSTVTPVQVGFQEDSPGWSFEFGVQFAFTRKFSGLFGYQYETNTGTDSRVEDTFSGVTFGAMVAF